MITSLDHLPLVCDIQTTAKALGRSVSAIEVDLANHRMQPAPIPDISGHKKQRRRWSKFAIEAWLKGGYLEFEQVARRSAKGKPRHFFGKANARIA